MEFSETTNRLYNEKLFTISFIVDRAVTVKTEQSLNKGVPSKTRLSAVPQMRSSTLGFLTNKN